MTKALILSINQHNYFADRFKSYFDSVIEIQKEHILDNAKSDQESFLVTLWRKEEIEELIIRGATLILALRDSRQVAGYAMVCEVKEFAGTLAVQCPDQWKYIYQIAVKKDFLGQGVARKMITSIFHAYSRFDLLADYMMAPFYNRTSDKLFQSLGFEKSGIFTLQSYRGFQPSTWQTVVSKRGDRNQHYSEILD